MASYKIFDFLCHDCDKRFEKLTTHPFNIECPYCGSTHTEKQLGGSSFKVTGQGAYTNKMKV